ncbi:MT-A70 family methyltransferase [Azospirillum sp. TSA6c]|uniref:MT-A70 family methyltransferase n=1 Tax=unclassified Azospirillum TaxID=2630922 RepID=UPI000D64F564|nr:MT-A70 family methyltransferase [Azospirillum sp. TSA6c]
MSYLRKTDLAIGDFGTCLARPPWKRMLAEAETKSKKINSLVCVEEEIINIPLSSKMKKTSHLYLFIPNSIVPSGIRVMKSWGFEYKSNIIMPMHTASYKDFKPKSENFFKDFTVMVLFGIRGKNARTFDPGRKQVNYVEAADEIYSVIEACSPGPYLEIFGENSRKNWSIWNGSATA